MVMLKIRFKDEKNLLFRFRKEGFSLVKMKE